MALMYLARYYPGSVEVILAHGALDLALKVVKSYIDFYDVLLSVAMFVAVVCRNGTTPDKVISSSIFQ